MGKTMETFGTAVKKTRTAKLHPTHEEIARRAYEIYLERGSAAGNEMEDWTRAERELMEKGRKTRRKAAPKAKAA